MSYKIFICVKDVAMKAYIAKFCMIMLCSTMPVSGQEVQENVMRYHKNPMVKAVFESLQLSEAELIQDWKAIARIYAPSGNEVLRAKYLQKKFKEYNIPGAYIDKNGNTIGVIDGQPGGPCIAFLATMDDLATVADLVKSWDKPIAQKAGRLFGPGTNIGGICTTILGLAKMFTHPEIQFRGKIMLVGVVQEETGSVGIKGLINDHPGEIDLIVDIMGGVGRISYGALGIHWFKIHFKGERGHTMRGGLPNVTRGVAKAVDRIYDIPLSAAPESRTHLNIAMLGAGKVYNHKSEDGWFSVDLRSVTNEALTDVKNKIFKIVKQVAIEENLNWEVEPYTETPAGQIPGARDSDLVRVAEECNRLFIEKVSLSTRGSSNMNSGIAANILSISLGGNRGGNRDRVDEYGNIEPIFTGMKVNFLLGYILTQGKLLIP